MHLVFIVLTDLNKENIRLVFGKLAIMKDVFNIIQENIPEVSLCDDAFQILLALHLFCD